MADLKDVLVDISADVQARMYPTYTGEECFALAVYAAFAVFHECTGRGIAAWSTLSMADREEWVKLTLTRIRASVAATSGPEVRFLGRSCSGSNPRVIWLHDAADRRVSEFYGKRIALRGTLLIVSTATSAVTVEITPLERARMHQDPCWLDATLRTADYDDLTALVAELRDDYQVGPAAWATNILERRLKKAKVVEIVESWWDVSSLEELTQGIRDWCAQQVPELERRHLDGYAYWTGDPVELDSASREQLAECEEALVAAGRHYFAAEWSAGDERAAAAVKLIRTLWRRPKNESPP